MTSGRSRRISRWMLKANRYSSRTSGPRDHFRAMALSGGASRLIAGTARSRSPSAPVALTRCRSSRGSSRSLSKHSRARDSYPRCACSRPEQAIRTRARAALPSGDVMWARSYLRAAVERVHLVGVARDGLDDLVARGEHARAQDRDLAGIIDQRAHDLRQLAARERAVQPARLALARVVGHAADRVGDDRDALGQELHPRVAVGLLPHRGHQPDVDAVEDCVELV